jgi:hypothetical protein
MWGHHLAFGPPFLQPGCRLELPVEGPFETVPEAGAPSAIHYLDGFGGEGTYTLRGERAGVRVTWDARTMPYLWVWQEHGATREYPWWGRLRALGLEPFSSFPTEGLGEAVRNGSALRLGPREARDFELTVTVLEGAPWN